MQEKHLIDYYKWDDFLINSRSTVPSPQKQTTKPTLKFPLCVAWSSLNSQWNYIAEQTSTIIGKLHPELTLTHVYRKDMCTSDDEKLLTVLVAFVYTNRFNSERGWVAAHVYLMQENYEFSYEFQPGHVDETNTTDSTYEKQDNSRGVLEEYPPEYWHPWQVAWGRPNAARNPITLSILGLITLPLLALFLNTFLKW